MTKSRARCILVAVERAMRRAQLAEWYAEVYGATPADAIPTERLRASIGEALREVLDAGT